MVEISPSVYTTLCALVHEALQNDSDAAPLLKRAAAELARVVANDQIPADLAEQPERVAALRRAGFVGN